ncbi:MAG: hypothetical protein WCX85_01860 [Bacilli bacterium]
MKAKFTNFLKEAWRPTLLIAVVCLVIYLLSLIAGDSTYFVFWGDATNSADATTPFAFIRDTTNFNWTFILIFAVVIYVYASELKNKNYRGIVAGLSLYSVHWLYEIANAIIGKASGAALWTVAQDSTSFILLIGVSWELSMMFALAGVIMSKLLPEDAKKKILGINNRWLFAIGNAAFFAIFEIFLAGTPAFIWVYPWWGAIPVFITTYIPFFLAAFLVPDTKPKTQRIFLMTTWGLVVILLAVLIPAGII